MKRFLTLPLTATFAALAMTGCNPTGGSNSRQYIVMLSSKETTGNQVTLTEYDWNFDAIAQVGERRTLNGTVVYEDSDFESTTGTSGQVDTRVRTNYATDGSITREKLATTYGLTYGGQLLETKFEVFVLGAAGDESTPVRHRETEWNSSGQYKSIKYYENGEFAWSHTNFDYSSMSYTATYTYVEKKGDGPGVTMYVKGTKAIEYTVVEYELYSGWDGTSGTLVEKKTDYSENDTTVAYTITRYDENGENPVETRVQNTLRVWTVES